VHSNLLLLAWAEKKRYLTRKGRLNTYRAGMLCATTMCVCDDNISIANHLLRLASDGRICLSFKPPQYSTNKG
jgi:hypothetical protein